MAIDPTLRKVYSVEGPDDCVDAYKDWAAAYEDDVVGRFGYVAPKLAAETFARFVSDTAVPVLDAGCGTGLAGVELAARGVTTVDGLDISRAMLDEARAKGVYRTLIEGDMTRPLPLDTDAYGAVISTGTFTHGHVGTEGLPDLLRVTRPGGIVCLTINDGVYEDYAFQAAFDTLAADGTVAVLENAQADYLRDQGIGCRLVTLQVR